VRRLALLLAACLLALAAPVAQAWTVTSGFETFPADVDNPGVSGTIGGDGFYSWGCAEVTTVRSNSGTKSCRFDLSSGSEDTGQHEYYPPTNLTANGQEIWVRSYWYFAPGFNFTALIIKLVRLHAGYPGSSPNATYHSIEATKPTYYGCNARGNDSYGYLVFASEWMDNNAWPYMCQNVQTTNYYLQTGRWLALEYYIKAGDNNNGIVRMWYDGTLIYQKLNVTTFKSGTGGYIGRKADGSNVPHILGWWNDDGSQPGFGVPVNQSFWFDDLVYTTDTPAGRDAFGNPMIGLTTAGTPPTVSSLTCLATSLQAPNSTTCTAVASQSPTSYAWTSTSCGTPARCTPTTPTVSNSTSYSCAFGGPCTPCVTASNGAGASAQYCATTDYLKIRYVQPSGFGAN
jgi:hypothetical protein